MTENAGREPTFSSENVEMIERTRLLGMLKLFPRTKRGVLLGNSTVQRRSLFSEELRIHGAVVEAEFREAFIWKLRYRIFIVLGASLEGADSSTLRMSTKYRLDLRLQTRQRSRASHSLEWTLGCGVACSWREGRSSSCFTRSSSSRKTRDVVDNVTAPLKAEVQSRCVESGCCSATTCSTAMQRRIGRFTYEAI